MRSGKSDMDYLLEVGQAGSSKSRLRGDGFGGVESNIAWGPLPALLSRLVTFHPSFSSAPAEVTPPIPCFLTYHPLTSFSSSILLILLFLPL